MKHFMKVVLATAITVWEEQNGLKGSNEIRTTINKYLKIVD